MFENNDKEKITKEINSFLDDIEKIKENVDVYCELMKKMFLSTSNLN